MSVSPSEHAYCFSALSNEYVRAAAATVSVATNAATIPVSITFHQPVEGESATIVGTSGNDDLIGTSDRDVIAGLGGNDHISGLGGNDLMCGGNGSDNISADAGNDFADGGSESTESDDIVDGGSGEDILLGHWK